MVPKRTPFLYFVHFVNNIYLFLPRLYGGRGGEGGGRGGGVERGGGGGGGGLRRELCFLRDFAGSMSFPDLYHFQTTRNQLGQHI